MSIDIEKEGLNSLIQKFLIELKNDANRKSSKMEFVYSNALKSLKNHDSKIMSINDCQKIKYIGLKTCVILQNKLDQYCKKNTVLNLPVSNTVISTDTVENNDNNILQDDLQINSCQEVQTIKNKRKNNKQYIPKFKSSGFAIMIALYKLEEDERRYSVSKIDLINAAETYFNDYSDNDVTTLKFNAWTAIKTLISKELIFVEKNRCNYYGLTEIGRELSCKMYTAMCEKKNFQDEIKNHEVSNLIDQDEPNETELNSFKAGTFEIILIVDSREHYSGVSSDKKKTKILSDLQNMGINCQMRTLPVGDFAWIVKPLTRFSPSIKKELVLDFLIERKKIDDLISSIRDQRWGEQKYRLKRCGLKNVTYLIEGLSSCKNDNTMYKSVIQALSNAQIIDGFNVKYTKDFNETLNYLAILTKFFEKYYLNQTLYICSKQIKLDNNFNINKPHLMSYNEFCCESMKMNNFTCKEMFVRNLLRFHGATLEKCKAITDIYETLPSLLQAYDECETEKAKDQLLSIITYGSNNTKTIGNLLSKKICTYYKSI